MAAGLGFFGGMKYQFSKTAQSTDNAGRGVGRFGKGGIRPTIGEIISADDKSITVKMADGTSKIVLISDKTQINKANKATKEDLKSGVGVAVFGTDNSDGSVTSSNIQLNPQFMGGRNRN